MRSNRICNLLLAGSLTSFAFAGTPVAEDLVHNHRESTVIDGSATSDLVPDQVAERMVLLTLGLPKKAAPEDLARQAAFVRDIGLSDEDSVVLIAEANEFVRGYRRLIAKYNKMANPGVADTPENFIANQRNPLVSTYVSRIRGDMSAFGVRAFIQYVRDFKLEGLGMLTSPSRLVRALWAFQE